MSEWEREVEARRRIDEQIADALRAERDRIEDHMERFARELGRPWLVSLGAELAAAVRNAP